MISRRGLLRGMLAGAGLALVPIRVAVEPLYRLKGVFSMTPLPPSQFDDLCVDALARDIVEDINAELIEYLEQRGRTRT